MSIKARRSLNIEGYCGKNGCCDSRNDDCNAYYISKNTTCYCDMFCDQKALGHVDCCPDYWTICAGQNLEQATTAKAMSSNFPDKTGKEKRLNGALN